jgi:hypothetical protein
MKLRFASSVLLLSLAVLFAAALRGRRSTQHVAELLSVTGVVQRQPDSNQRWSAAAAGARFSYGSALRTLAASTAMVRMQAGGGLGCGSLCVAASATVTSAGKTLADRGTRAPG